MGRHTAYSSCQASISYVIFFPWPARQGRQEGNPPTAQDDPPSSPRNTALGKLEELKMKKHHGIAKRKIRILIVDDLEFPRMVIRNMLHDLGYESHNNLLEAANGLEAFQVLQESRIDLIICDWLMPVMTGLELLQKIRATPELAKTPFIMLTAEAEKKNIMDAIKAGVSQYIVKPFTAETLYQKIESAFVKPG